MASPPADRDRGPVEASQDNPGLHQQRTLRESALDLIRVLNHGILADEAFAEEIARIADGDAVSDMGIEEALRAIARNHRIRALEAQARLAGVTEIYARVLDPI